MKFLGRRCKRGKILLGHCDNGRTCAGNSDWIVDCLSLNRDQGNSLDDRPRNLYEVRKCAYERGGTAMTYNEECPIYNGRGDRNRGGC